VRVLLLPVAGESVAVDLASLRVVVDGPRLFPVPTAPSVVLGAVNIRGQVVPVLDTARLLGIGTIDVPAFIVVVDHPSGAVAVAGEGAPATAILGELVAPGTLRGAVGTYATNAATVATLLDVATLVEPAAA
jgi:hypothetical protein